MKKFLDLFKGQKNKHLYFALQVDYQYAREENANYYNNTNGYSVREIREAITTMQKIFDQSLTDDRVIRIYITAKIGRDYIYEKSILMNVTNYLPTKNQQT